MPETKDLINADDVTSTYTEGKYICFVLKNGFTVKLDPNKVSDKGSEINKEDK